MGLYLLTQRCSQSDYGLCDVTVTVIDGTTYTGPKTSTSRTQPASSSTTTTSSQATSASQEATSSAPAPGPTGPSFVPGLDDFVLEGCYAEPDGRRALQNMQAHEMMTIETCLSLAGGHNYAGIEYGRECWYGDGLSGGSLLPSTSDCTMTCSGDQSQYCGAGNRLVLYKVKGYTPPAGGPGIVPSAGAYRVLGCYAEPAGGRALAQLYDAADMTVEKCMAAAGAAGARYAGIEYGRECWYANALSGGNLLSETDNCVTMTCGGNPNQYCGSGGHLILYSSS